MFSFLKKKFTLIELIVVIAVLGILAAIVIPNVGNMRDEADIARVKSDTKSIQTAVDLYATKNFNQVPTTNQPTVDKPEAIDFTKLYPKYIKKIPRNTLYYWVDFNHEVFVATTEAPKNVVNTNGTLTWEANGTKYYVYEAVGLTEGASQQVKLVGDTASKSMSGLVSGQKYLVQAEDTFGNDTAMTGSQYSGYTGTIVQNPNIGVLNNKPVSVITMTPASSIDNSMDVTFSYSSSTDVDKDVIVSGEWKLDGISVTNPNQKFLVGSHTVELRVYDGKDWSDWTSKTFTVVKKNTIPVASITINIASPTSNDTVTFSSAGSTDADGDSIASVEWKKDGTIVANPNGAYSVGSHTVELRVNDGKDWSISVSKTFTVTQAPVYESIPDKTGGVASAQYTSAGATPATVFGGTYTDGITWSTGYALLGPKPSFWIQYKYSTQQIINHIAILSAESSGFEAIKDFDVVGSNTGAFTGEETLLYSGTHPTTTFTGYVDYYFTNNNAYQYYRIKVKNLSAGNGNDDGSVFRINMSRIVGANLNGVSYLPISSSVVGTGSVGSTGVTASAWKSPTTPGTAWYQLNLTTPTAVNKIAVTSYATSGWEAIKDYDIYASNTGTFTGEEKLLVSGTHPNDVTGTPILYHFVNDTAYKYYRIVVKTNYVGNGGDDNIIQKLEMFRIN